MTLQNNYSGILPHENDILEDLAAGGYFKAIDQAKLSKQKFLETLIKLQEEERKKLGHELHDSVNASLTIAKFYLNLLPADTEKQQYAKEQLAYIISCTEQSIRTISCDLVVFQETEASLIKLVKNLVQKIDGLKLFNIIFKYSNKKQLDEMPDCQKIVLYRIVQEQMNNTIKYSKATKVTITLSISNNLLKFIKLVIKDNGVGFDMTIPSNGIGLSNISNRIKQFDGHTRVKSAPGKGCMVDVCMPVLQY